jgi:hypothetical protein
MHAEVLPWLEYRWTFDFPTGMFRAVLERLRGTPARLEELVRGASPAAMARRAGGKWSAQNGAGHLWVVDALWQIRLREFLAGAATLTAADMGNRATEASAYDEQPLPAILAGFRAARAETVAMLDPLTLADAGRVARHPRLDREIRLVDLCFFAAEHDDHHLAVIREQLATGS